MIDNKDVPSLVDKFNRTKLSTLAKSFPTIIGKLVEDDRIYNLNYPDLDKINSIARNLRKAQNIKADIDYTTKNIKHEQKYLPTHK
jgi:hypothetical protein